MSGMIEMIYELRSEFHFYTILILMCEQVLITHRKRILRQPISLSIVAHWTLSHEVHMPSVIDLEDKR